MDKTDKIMEKHKSMILLCVVFVDVLFAVLRCHFVHVKMINNSNLLLHFFVTINQVNNKTKLT